MRTGLLLVVTGLLGVSSAIAQVQGLRLQPGYIYRVRCEGRLLVSAVGNEGLLRLEALPKELGCGAVLKPLHSTGRTNLILETSAGTVIRTVEISAQSHERPEALEIDLSRRVQ